MFKQLQFKILSRIQLYTDTQKKYVHTFYMYMYMYFNNHKIKELYLVTLLKLIQKHFKI